MAAMRSRTSEALRPLERVLEGAAVGRPGVEEALLREALPRRAAWLRAAENAGNAWRGMDHHLAVHYRGGVLRFDEFQ